MNKTDTYMSILDKSTQIQLENFKVLPKFVGTWSGNWIILDRDAKEIDRFTSNLTQKIVNNQWLQTNQNKYPNGKIEELRFFGKIVGNGTLVFESPDYPYCNWEHPTFAKIRKHLQDRGVGLKTQV